MSPLNDDWARYKVPDCEPPSTPPPKPADSRSAVVPPNLDALLAENQRLREALERIETSSGSPNVVWIAREALAGDAQ